MTEQNWVSEWMKTDPYMIDIEGFEKFVKEKEKELRVQISVDLCDGGFQLFVEVPSSQIPTEQKNESEVARKEEQVQIVADRINELLKQLGKTERNGEMVEDSEGLRPGSVHVTMRPPLVCRPDICLRYIQKWKEAVARTNHFTIPDDEEEEPVWWRIMKEEWNNCEWVYHGDESHCGEENIQHNAKILWQIWNAIGKLVPTCYGIGKPYQCDSIYLYCYEATQFPQFGIMETDVLHVLREHYDHEIRLLKIETTELDEIGVQLNGLGKTLLSMEIPNTEDIYRDDYVWILGEQPLPVMSMIRGNIPEVLEYLSTGGECWDPENDSESLYLNGGVEMIHPFLRRELKLKWTEDDVVWSEQAEEYRTLFYTRFNDSELAAKTVEELSRIASAKGIRGHSRKQDLIDAILEANDKPIVNTVQIRTDRPPSMRYTPEGQTFSETGWMSNWEKGIDETGEIVGKTVADVATGQTGTCIRRRQTPLGSVVQVQFKFTDGKIQGETLWFWQDEVQMLDV